MSNHSSTMKTLLAGIAAAATVLTCGPSASADPDQTNDQTTDQTEQKPGQDDAAGIADKTAEGASKGVEGAEKGLEGAEKAAEGASKAGEAASQAGGQPNSNPPKDLITNSHCMIWNGVPTIMPRYAERTGTPFDSPDEGKPCWLVFGVTPTR